MKKVKIVIVALSILAVAAFAGADEKKASTEQAGEQTIKGEIVDTHCYLSRGAKGEEHAGCGNACLSRDVPAGLLAEDGTLYLLLNEKSSSVKEKVAGKAGKKVVAHGKIVERNGLKAFQLVSID
jgi:type 1 fimbria pilin